MKLKQLLQDRFHLLDFLVEDHPQIYHLAVGLWQNVVVEAVVEGLPKLKLGAGKPLKLRDWKFNHDVSQLLGVVLDAICHLSLRKYFYF